MSLEMPFFVNKKLAVAFHTSATGYFIFIIYKLVNTIDYGKVRHHPKAEGYSRTELYLTTWYYVLHILYFFGRFFYHVYTATRSETKFSAALNKFLHLLFISVAFPIGLTVVITFWIIFSYDRELVFPEFMDKAFPLWGNHVVHTYIGPFILIEIFLVNFNNGEGYYWKNHIASMKLLSFFIGLYIICMVAGKQQIGYWIYPIFDEVPLVIVVVPVIMTTIVYYFLGVAINGAFFKYFVSNYVKVEKKTS